MSEWVNLIWSEVKFDAIYSESCVCLLDICPFMSHWLSQFFTPFCELPGSSALPGKHTPTVNGRKTLEKALHVCVFKEITEVVLKRQKRQSQTVENFTKFSSAHPQQLLLYFFSHIFVLFFFSMHSHLQILCIFILLLEEEKTLNFRQTFGQEINLCTDVRKQQWIRCDA